MSNTRLPRALDYHVERIRMDMDGQMVLHTVSLGNPGALNVLVMLLKSEDIDPEAFPPLGGYLPIIELDRLGIYGPFVWGLYRDLCDSNIARVRAVLRATSLDLLSQDDLAEAIEACRSGHGQTFDVAAVVRKVRAKLPSFDTANVSKVD